MNRFKNAFIAHLKKEGIKFVDRDEKIVSISYRGDNMPSIDIIVAFDADEKPDVSLRCWTIAKFPEDKMLNGLVASNELNKQYRFVRFCVDKDNDLNCEADIDLTENSCGELILKLVRRMVNIVDDAYPVAMKALWGN